jgi:hypothetical protein
MLYTLSIRCSRLLNRVQPGSIPVLVPSPALLFAALTIPFSPFRLAKSNASLFAVGQEKSLLPYVAQHPLSLNLLSEAFE